MDQIFLANHSSQNQLWPQFMLTIAAGEEDWLSPVQEKKNQTKPNKNKQTINNNKK